MMRIFRITGASAAVAVMLLSACAGRKGPPDPVEVQRQLTATLDGEKELIRSTVVDSERADKVIALLDERDQLVAEHRETIQSYRETMTAFNSDYGAERESIEGAISNYNTKRAESQRQFVELIDAMKRETTAEEWKVISKYQIKKLNLRTLIYRQPGGGS